VLATKIVRREPGILTYGLTPPKAGQQESRLREIAQRQMERIRSLSVDGVIVYDLQDEQDRVHEQRPFPFIETIDPGLYSREYLAPLSVPRVIYRCAGKYEPEWFRGWIRESSDSGAGCPLMSVFVGAASSRQQVTMSLKEAYSMAGQEASQLLLGGVVIPERHLKKQDEHLRAIEKMKQGCQFFVSQAVYHAEAAKNFLSDYYYRVQEEGLPMAPVLLTLTPCGSEKTLSFMKWLGVSIPRWLENELVHSSDILDESVRLSRNIFQELYEFGLQKSIPIGCNVESVSVRKVEIEASVQLAEEIRGMMQSVG